MRASLVLSGCLEIFSKNIWFIQSFIPLKVLVFLMFIVSSSLPVLTTQKTFRYLSVSDGKSQVFKFLVNILTGDAELSHSYPNSPLSP